MNILKWCINLETAIGDLGLWEGSLGTQKRMDAKWDSRREWKEVQRLILHSSTSNVFHQLLVYG